MDQAELILSVSIGTIVVSFAVLAISLGVMLFYYLQTKWKKMLHRWLTHSILLINLMIIINLTVVGSVGVPLIFKGVATGSASWFFVWFCYYLNGLLIPLLIYLILILGSMVLETFSVLIPQVTPEIMKSWRIFLTLVSGICFVPSIIQFFIGISISDPQVNTPFILKMFVFGGNSIIGILAMVIDIVQTLIIAAAVLNWTKTRPRSLPNSANEALYKRSVSICFLTIIIDWTGLLCEVLAYISGLAYIFNVLLKGIAVLFIVIHSYCLIYQFQLMKSIAVAAIQMEPLNSMESKTAAKTVKNEKTPLLLNEFAKQAVTPIGEKETVLMPRDI